MKNYANWENLSGFLYLNIEYIFRGVKNRIYTRTKI